MWDKDTDKVIANLKWTGNRKLVWSICWSRGVVNESNDGSLGDTITQMNAWIISTKSDRFYRFYLDANLITFNNYVVYPPGSGP